MLNFRLGNLTVGVSYEALQKHAHIEKFGSGRSVVGLKKKIKSLSLWKNAFLRHGNPSVNVPNFH